MRILAVDDHELFRRCMVDFLDAQENIEVIGETSSAQVAMEITEKTKPDIALIDLDLGSSDGLDLSKKILKASPGTIVAILTGSKNNDSMLDAIRIGVRGYLIKDIKPDSLVNALHRMIDGANAFPRSFLLNQVISGLDTSEPSQEPPEDVVLTSREKEVLQLVTDGLMDKEIAERLFVSENTVKNHMKNLRRKLGASNRLQASMIGLKMGIIKQYSQLPVAESF